MKIIAANFKMNLNKKEITDYIDTIQGKINKENCIFFPSNIYLNYFSGKNYLIGSQNISFQEWGAITGDISVLQLKDAGINYTLLGHSERREYFNDSNYISKKVNLALKNNIKIILCVGEKEDEFEKKLTLDVIKKELDDAILTNLELINDNNLIIAYEPIWAIGTGKTPTNDILEKTIFSIKNYIQEKYQLKLKVLYGGSVNLDNIDELETIKNIDGYLVGGACLNPNKFISLINKVK